MLRVSKQMITRLLNALTRGWWARMQRTIKTEGGRCSRGLTPMNITPEILLQHGYKKHRHHEAACDFSLYQRTVRHEEYRGRKLYFITFYFWDLSTVFEQAPKRTTIEVNTRLYLPAGDTFLGGGGFDLNLHLEPTATLEQVEAFYERAYSGLGCGPDWHNQ
jgi:hypothetical protein